MTSNPDATVMSGYSMGGWASYKLPEEYPDLFAQSMPLEGPVICGLRIYGQAQSYAGPGQCTNDGDSAPLIVNLKWIPYVMTYGAIDELVPFAGGQQQIGSTSAASATATTPSTIPTEDHMVFSVQNDFTPGGLAAWEPATESRTPAHSLSPGIPTSSARSTTPAGAGRSAPPATTGSAACRPATASPARWPRSAPTHRRFASPPRHASESFGASPLPSRRRPPPTSRPGKPAPHRKASRR